MQFKIIMQFQYKSLKSNNQHKIKSMAITHNNHKTQRK